jgi:hypothetical protein
VAVSGCWTRVFIDRERCFVYGPSLGRLYLLAREQSLERHLQTLLGLGSLILCDEIADPAERIVHNLSTLRSTAPVDVPVSLRIAYRLLHYSRHAIPLAVIVAFLRWIAKRRVDNQPTISDLGRLVYSIERAVGYGDCYPRALLTCYLCLRSGRSCDLAVGTLAPTRKMHAWCSVEGQLPYEASPEHYMYAPLLVMTLTP